MGRGRQKAKQARVARELKYFSPETNLSELQKELSGNSVNDTPDLEAWPEYAADSDDLGEFEEVQN